jgi:hypothetical protein
MHEDSAELSFQEKMFYIFRFFPLRRAIVHLLDNPLIFGIEKINNFPGVVSPKGTFFYLPFFLRLVIWEKRAIVYIFGYPCDWFSEQTKVCDFLRAVSPTMPRRLGEARRSISRFDTPYA